MIRNLSEDEAQVILGILKIPSSELVPPAKKAEEKKKEEEKPEAGLLTDIKTGAPEALVLL